ncbi:hypothetical protein TBR22_A24100 [Luteitalea sp. TBR-22]|uniref:acyl carrier protein n=1 Tax=Luteitalea sp. TBR-22 TaxID=2802971 RepID=UPI001AFB7B0E|nr:acyl carrier protein [Luteitalea sp. TBR-22]BCS33183.1 hypothetical protein TBR22_A24100 [Luteitalea sp. TBR-22]
MTDTDVSTKLKQLIAHLFKVSVDELSDEVGPGDVSGWDSLGHVTLMVEIQKQFGTHIPVEDAIEVESIADIVRLLEREGSAA